MEPQDMPNPTGKIYSFIGLFPISKKTDFTKFRQYLRSLANDTTGSPLSVVQNIHTARLAIMDEAFSEGMPEPPDQFARRYLIFACCYNGRTVSDLTDRLADKLPDKDFREIWGKCHDCPKLTPDPAGKERLAHYFKQHQLNPNFFTSLQLDRTVPEILRSLELKQCFTSFVFDNQAQSPIELQANFRQFWAKHKTQAPRPRTL
jgi:hypothetical protein